MTCAALAGAAAVLAVAGCGGDATADEGGWLRHEDRDEGLGVLYPEGWNRSTTSLTPNLTEPRELLSLGTHGLRPGSERCAQMPGNALDDMTELDAFVTVQERDTIPDAPVGAESFPVRPDDFRLDARDADVGAACSENGGIQSWWIPFRDEGRAFYLQVAIGKSASEDTRRQVSGILESLRFNPMPAQAVPPTKRGQLPDGRSKRRIPNTQQ
jgi:hypothetical protein